MLEANMRMSIDTDVMDSGGRNNTNTNANANVPSLKLPGNNDNSALQGGMASGRSSHRSIRHEVLDNKQQQLYIDDDDKSSDKFQDEEEDDLDADITIFDAFTQRILRDCKETALGTCLTMDLQRFVDSLDMYKQVANFPILELFKFSRFEEGLPKSTILQKEKIEQLRKERESQGRIQTIAQSVKKSDSAMSQQSVNSKPKSSLGEALKATMLKRITMPAYGGAVGKNRKKINKSSLLIALCRLNPALPKSEQTKTHDEVLDELTCYIERTIQLLWLNYKIGMFSAAKNPSSLIFRLYNQARDHYKLTMIKLKHRLKVSSFLLMQMCPEDQLVASIKEMNHYQLMQLKVSIKEALQSNEFTINLGGGDLPAKVINNMIQSSTNSLDTGLGDLNVPNANPKSSELPKIEENKNTGLLTIDLGRVEKAQETAPDPSAASSKKEVEELTPVQIAQAMRKDIVSIMQSNLVINGCQLAQRKQLGRILHKYFGGYQSGLSIKLLIEAIEFHYEGLDENAKEVLGEGLTDLLSECSRTLHRDELFQNKPIDMHDVSRMFMTTNETAESSRFPNNKQRAGPHISAHDFGASSQDPRDLQQNHITVVEDSASEQLLIVSDGGNKEKSESSKSSRSHTSMKSGRSKSSMNIHGNLSPQNKTSLAPMPTFSGQKPREKSQVSVSHSSTVNTGSQLQARLSNARKRNTEKQLETIEAIINQAAQVQKMENSQDQQGSKQNQLNIEEVTAVANRVNNDLKAISFIGQFQNVSSQIPRNSSVYADPILPDADVDVQSQEHVMHSNQTESTLQRTKEKNEENRPSALFGDKSSQGLQTSIDSVDMKMMAGAGSQDNDENLQNARMYRETIQLQDLVMMTDIYSIPQLLQMFSQSGLNESEIEYQILEQVAHQEDTILKRKQRKRSEISVVIPYNGATISFVVATLAAFGLTAIQFAKSREKVKVCKVKLDGLFMTEQELLLIVHKIEMIFHMAQHAESYKNLRYFSSQINIAASPRLPSEMALISDKENQLLKIMQQMHKKNKKRLVMQKNEYQKLTVLEIQNYLSREYHFNKWFLVEILELQEREIAAYGFKKQFSDSVNFIRGQHVDKSMELADQSKRMTVQSLMDAIDIMVIQRKTVDIQQETQDRFQKDIGTDYIANLNKNNPAINHNQSVQHASHTSGSVAEEPFRGEESAALKTSPGVHQLHRLVECIQLSQLQSKHIDFMNKLLKKREKTSMLLMRCRNITPEMIAAMQEQKENEERALESTKFVIKERQQAPEAHPNGSGLGTGAAFSRLQMPSNANLGANIISNQHSVRQDSQTAESANFKTERHPLLPTLNPDEESLEEVAISIKLDSICQQKINQCFLKIKQMLINRLQRTESLLICIDRRMHQKRVSFVELLKYVGGGIEERENSIKQQLRDISHLEMEKSKDEDLLSEATLKTIEIVNIADIAQEKKQLESQINGLLKTQQDLDVTELLILREQKRRNDKKAAKEDAKKKANQ